MASPQQNSQTQTRISLHSLAVSNSNSLSIASTQSQPNIPTGDEESWRNAVEGYTSDEYCVKGFEALHLLSIHYYERDLSRLEHELVLNKGISPGEDEAKKVQEIRTALRNYSTAVSDLETMLRRPCILPSSGFGGRADWVSARTMAQNGIDKFSIEEHLYELKPELRPDFVWRMLDKILPPFLKYPFAIAVAVRQRANDAESTAGIQSSMHSQHSNGPNQDDKKRKKRYRQSDVVDQIGRVIMTLLAGAALLIPMIVMTFRTSRNSRITTVTVSVVIFGLILSIATKATNQEILAATAAYAAVMVVYIGTATTN